LDLNAFCLTHLPPAPARVLEVGCGSGELARALAGAGYRVLAIDPEAPEGAIFRRVRLEELDDPGPFDAVVASRSLHHVDDLGASLDRVTELLGPDGRVLVDDFGWDLLDLATATWLAEQEQTALAELLAQWADEHAGLHTYESMRRELDRHFEKLFLTREPYLYRSSYRTDEAAERATIDGGAIAAIGFRYVGYASSG
jgi:2-polyprenyl-3-methyl-5-hydroxy-6-metoxy-1,4-benzoquinol methylase